MKTPFLAFVLMLVGLIPVISDEAPLAVGSLGIARDPTGSVLAGDSPQSLDKLMEFARDQDQKAITELMKKGHVISIKNGLKVEILSFDSGENAYKVRAVGFARELWLIKENVFAK